MSKAAEPPRSTTIEVGGSIRAKSVVGRDQVNVEQLIVQVYQGAPPLRLDDAALQALRAEYLAFGRVGIGPRAERNTRAALVAVMQGTGMEARRRREAGMILGDIGWRPEDLDAFVAVEPGEFLYGEDKERQTIPYRYWIGKYPVTNCQFALFVEVSPASGF